MSFTECEKKLKKPKKLKKLKLEKAEKEIDTTDYACCPVETCPMKFRKAMGKQNYNN